MHPARYKWVNLLNNCRSRLPIIENLLSWFCTCFSTWLIYRTDCNEDLCCRLPIHYVCKTFNGTTVRLITNYLFHKRNILILTLRLAKIKLTPPSTLPIRASLFSLNFKHASGRLFEVKIQVKQHATKPFESCMPTLQRDLSIKTYNLDKTPAYCSSISGIPGDLDCLGFGDSIYAGLRVIASGKETPKYCNPPK